MSDKASSSRRNFLKLAAVGAPVVAVSAAAKAATGETVEAIGDADGYRKTEHVRKYLESARF